MSKLILEARDLKRDYKQGGNTLQVLKALNFSILSGEMVALVGPSGSGKSTLLQCCGLLDTPTDGQVLIEGNDAGGLNDKKRAMLRRDKIGFIYQFHHLLPEFSALENVMMPQLIAGVPKAKAREKAEKILSKMKLSERLSHRPAQLSGGEQQRVSIARAIANKPSLLLADEPTGNLDPETSEMVYTLFEKIVRSTGVGALVATHNMDLARRMDRILVLEKGVIGQQVVNNTKAA